MAGSILAIDDEQSILRAIKRLLRRDGYNIHLASSGQEALTILENNPDIAVIICDQRMPGMDGPETLSRAAKMAPNTIRMTLTGQTDLNSAMKSINEGQITHFILKPWNDDHLRKIVGDAVRSYNLEIENKRLEELTRKQKEELEQWNKQLEEKVEKRTKAIKLQMDILDKLRTKLESSLRDTVAILASMLEGVSPSLGIHSKRVARLSLELGKSLGLEESELRDLEFAAHLHDIGKLILLGEKQTNASKAKNKTVPFPQTGFNILSQVGGFDTIAKGVYSQKEKYDGTGTPDRLKGKDIPLISRIITLVNAYDEKIYSNIKPTMVSWQEGQSLLRQGSGKMFDPELVDAFLDILDQRREEILVENEVELSPKQLKEGMIIARDLKNIVGNLLLKNGTILTPELIAKIRLQNTGELLLSGVCVKCTSQSTEEQNTNSEEVNINKI